MSNLDLNEYAWIAEAPRCECGETHPSPIVYQAGRACPHCGLHPYDGHGGDCPNGRR